ncbi:unnamed protein product [Blepharisma stoltei]|uniref:Uncharacterized protein n=1 Tax=Blepharisma stoltei TaxID=1481888 RepID=A0AAU9IHV2_9CILI|nr:unnamed protein product [Blepharisma stoltei]
MKNKGVDLNSSIRLSMRKVQNARNEYLNITENTLPQDTTQRVATWRNSIDTLQKDLRSHGEFLKQLRRETPSSIYEVNKGTSFLMKVSEKFSNDFKVLINILKNSAHLPKTCEYKTWDLVLQSVSTEISKLNAASVSQNQEGVHEILCELYDLKENLTSQIFKSMMHRKIVLWMDLNILETGYVKGEILDIVQNIVDYKNEHGYIPAKIDYVHPKISQELPQINSSPKAKVNFIQTLTAFTDEFQTMIRMIENNFQLNTSKKKSPNAKSLRNELEQTHKNQEKLEEEVQNLRIMMRNPDRREWFQMTRDLEEKSMKIEHDSRQIQKINMEKISLESENLHLAQHAKQLEAQLAKINETFLPRLEEAEKIHAELIQEIKNIRQDAELLPGMFRNEAFMKKKIRDEKIITEDKMNQAIEELEKEKQKIKTIIEEKQRKEKIAMQAVAARNLIDKELKEAQAFIVTLQGKITDQSNFEQEMKLEVEKYKKRHDEMQEHIYAQNNRINELEDQKKVLLSQLKESGGRSQAHYTYRTVKGNNP